MDNISFFQFCVIQNSLFPTISSAAWLHGQRKWQAQRNKTKQLRTLNMYIIFCVSYLSPSEKQLLVRNGRHHVLGWWSILEVARVVSHWLNTAFTDRLRPPTAETKRRERSPLTMLQMAIRRVRPRVADDENVQIGDLRWHGNPPTRSTSPPCQHKTCSHEIFTVDTLFPKRCKFTQNKTSDQRNNWMIVTNYNRNFKFHGKKLPAYMSTCVLYTLTK